jgi:hypothetical protein
MNEAAAAQVSDQWKFLIFFVACFTQIIILTVIFLVLFCKTKPTAVNLFNQEVEVLEMVEATPNQ